MLNVNIHAMLCYIGISDRMLRFFDVSSADPFSMHSVKVSACKQV